MLNKKTHPVLKKQYEMRLARISDHIRSNSPMMRIPPIAASECQMLLEAYHGGRWKTIFALTGMAIFLLRHDLNARFVIWLCDLAGWTKVYDIPETEKMRAHKQRHGRKCSGSPNCQNVNCIDDSIPAWFKFISRWDK